MAKLTRRTALAALATGTGLLGVGYLLRNIIDTPSGHANGPGMRGVSGTDMSRYMNMFMRHGELRRSVVDIPGGIAPPPNRTPDLVAELQAHVSSMYSPSRTRHRGDLHERKPADPVRSRP